MASVAAWGQVQFAYDAAGERTTLTYPSGHQATYAYSARGQLQSVTDWNTKQTTYTYDNAGRLMAIAYPNGLAGALSYDTADRLSGVAYTQGSSNLETIGYTRDAAGNPTQMTDSTGTTMYGYDALDRLTSATYPNGDAVAYAYDPVGNRTGLTVNGAQTTNTYDAADRLTQSGATAYTYDATGNELTKAAGGVTTTYAYDPLGRLTGIAGPTTASYSYNGDGLRVAKTVNGAATSDAWDPSGLGNVLADGAGEYLWGQGLIGQVTASGTTYAQADGLGSMRLLTDASGAVAGRDSYDAYGASRSQSGAQLPFEYAGEQTDGESGLVYLRARYLDPATGRFLTKDPLDIAGDGTDLYRYASDDPTTLADPSGAGPLKVAIYIVTLIDGRFSVSRTASTLVAQNARRRGGNVLVVAESEDNASRVARQIESGVDPTQDMLHHDPHGEGYLPHYQTDGYTGHTFYQARTIIPGADFGQRVADKTGCPLLGAVVDVLNPLSDVQAVVDLLDELNQPQVETA